MVHAVVFHTEILAEELHLTPDCKLTFALRHAGGFLPASLAKSVVPSCHDLLVVDLSNGDKGSCDILPGTLSAIFQPRVVVFDRCRPSVLHNNMQVIQARVKTSHGLFLSHHGNQSCSQVPS